MNLSVKWLDFVYFIETIAVGSGYTRSEKQENQCKIAGLKESCNEKRRPGTWLADKEADVVSEDWSISIKEIAGKFYHHWKFCQLFNQLSGLLKKLLKFIRAISMEIFNLKSKKIDDSEGCGGRKTWLRVKWKKY